MDAKRFGAFLQQRRKELGMTQSELAEKIHVTDKAISRWERAVGFPDIKLLEPLAEGLELSMTELLNCQVLPQEQARELEAETAQILESEIKLSWQRKLILCLGNAIILAAGFVLVYLSHQAVLPANLRTLTYAIALIGAGFSAYALKFMVAKLYLNREPWNIWENLPTWIAWGMRTVGFVTVFASRRSSGGYSAWTWIGLALIFASLVLRMGRKEEKE